MNYRYEIELPVSGGEWINAGELSPAALHEARAQTIFLAQRRGLAPADEAGVAVNEKPFFATAQKQVDFLVLEARCDERSIERTFGDNLFGPLARDAVLQQLKAGQPIELERNYRITASALPPAGSTNPSIRLQRSPLPLVRGELNKLLDKSTWQGPTGDDYPIFITAEALELSLELSREFSRGPAEDEGGALLVGQLFLQTEPAEIFAVIDVVLQAQDAQHGKYNLDLTAATYSRFEKQLALRRKRIGRPETVLGFSHGHPFEPSALDGKPKCAGCPLQPTCDLSSAKIYSQQDQIFHRAMFGRSPYAVGLVWGLTPRHENHACIYQQDGSSARERGFYVLSATPPLVTLQSATH
jgi:hypothetical protein